MANLLQKIWRMAGEISKLRQGGLSAYYGGPVYTLDSAQHVDYQLARDLYYNRKDEYKLGAGFAKPIVNTIAGFMGTPRFVIADETSQQWLDAQYLSWVSRMYGLHRGTLLLGDGYCLLGRDAATNKIKLTSQAPDGVDYDRDALTGAISRAQIRVKADWKDENRFAHQYTLTMTYTPQEIRRVVDGEPPAGMTNEQQRNPWGFVPLVHFRNEPDDTLVYGISELEPVEPYLKLYHDVLLQAAQGSKMHSTPRMQFKLADVKTFLTNNFPDVCDSLARGEKATISLTGKEMLLLQAGDDAGFVEAKSAIGDTAALLKLIFYCIVDVSEVPEFAFGVHMGSSLGNGGADQQSPILIRRIQRKREMVNDDWLDVATMATRMGRSLTGRTLQDALSLEWDEVMGRDEAAEATKLQSVASALNIAVTAGFLSLETATDIMLEFLKVARKYATDDAENPGERERIVEGMQTLRALEDEAFNQALAKQLAALNAGNTDGNANQ